jgi:probable rRNA maturation factor
MINVRVHKQSSYPVSTPKIKKALKNFLKKKGIVSDAEVSVAIVGEAKMKNLGEKYLKESGEVPHNVLTFTSSEASGNFEEPPDNTIRLGEIVLCFPIIKNEAKEQDKLIDERAIELVEHGAAHLLGIHHD